MKILQIFLLALIVLIGGCATTRIQSLTSYRHKKPFHKILLFVPEKNLILRHEIEQAIKGCLVTSDEMVSMTFGKGQIKEIKWIVDDSTTADTIIYVCSEVIPLWDEYSPERLDFELSDFGFDATLIVAPEEYWTSSVYIPQKTGLLVTDNVVAMKTVGGYAVSVLHGRYDCRMYNFMSDELLWKATAISSSSLLDVNIEKSFAKKLVEQLQKDGVMPNKKITKLRNL